MQIPLFVDQPFTTHSGLHAEHKIECDALSGLDLKTLAKAMRRITGPVRWAYGVPRGGLQLAEMFNKYYITTVEDPTAQILIIDDVFTTGRSMEKERAKLQEGAIPIIGMVVFARGPLQPWIRALYTEHKYLWPTQPIAPPKSPLELVMEMNINQACRTLANLRFDNVPGWYLNDGVVLNLVKSSTFSTRAEFFRALDEVLTAENNPPPNAKLAWPDALMFCTSLTYIRAYIMALWAAEAKRKVGTK